MIPAWACPITASCAVTNPDLKVACIGSGPSSITVAEYLAARGIKVTVFEALHEAGGVLIYGIPAFRLPKDVVAAELDGLRQNNVEFRTNWVGGRTVSVQQLFDEGYKAVFIGVGAGLPQFLGIPGENLIGVFSANEYLTRVNLGRAYDFPNFDTPTYPGKHVTVLAPGTWRWTPRVRLCASGRKVPQSFIAARALKCPRVMKRSNTRKRKA